MDKEKLTTIILGAAVALLGATGLVTADEGNQITACGVSAATGVIGLVEVIRAIIKRRKNDGD